MKKRGNIEARIAANEGAKAEFRGIVEQIKEISLPLMEKRARVNYMDAQKVAKGKKLGKQQKLALPLYLKRKEKHQAKIQEARELERGSGVKVVTTDAYNYRDIVRQKKDKIKQAKKRKAERLF